MTSIIRRSPFLPIRLNDVIDDMFESLFSEDFAQSVLPQIEIPRSPVADIWVEDDGKVFIAIASTARKKEDIKIEIDENILTVSSAAIKESETNKRIICDRIFKGEFTFRYRLSVKQDADSITSKLEDGLLTISIALKENAKNAKKQIAIE